MVSSAVTTAVVVSRMQGRQPLPYGASMELNAVRAQSS